jgi:predicted MFS family arabinose efflux permease
MLKKNPWLMWAIAVSFFAFQFILRVFPGLIVPEMMTKFHIDATSLGLLSASYYLGYAGMQIPVGILLDRFSPRYVISACAAICGLGTLSFVYSDTWVLTLLGRFLIGAGSAAGFLGTAKTVRMAFPEEKFTGMIGVTFTVGLAGALYGGKPMGLLIERMGWVQVLNLLAGLSLLIAVGVYLFFPADQDVGPARPGGHLRVGTALLSVLKNRKLIWVGIAGALMVGPLEGFADVWGISYLVNVYGFTKIDASLITSCIFFGMLFGGPILSYVAQRWHAFYEVTAFCGLGMATVFGVILLTRLFVTQIPLMILMTLVGVLSCYQVIVFAIASKLAPPELSGMVTSVTNCINMSAGCLVHFLMGGVMDLQWSGGLSDGIRIYEPAAYSSAVAIIPIGLLLGLLGFGLLRKYYMPERLINN